MPSKIYRVTPFGAPRSGFDAADIVPDAKCRQVTRTHASPANAMPNLIDNLKRIIQDHEPEPDEHALPRAAAVLLLELAVADAGIDDSERRVIERAMLERFELDEREVAALIEEAALQQRESHSLHEFTHQLRTQLSPDARGELVEWLWKVGFADGRLDRHEEHLVRRLADLLGVSHREFIRRKHRAIDDD